MGIASINKTKTWFFEKTEKVDKPLAKLTNVKRVKVQMNTVAPPAKNPHLENVRYFLLK